MELYCYSSMYLHGVDMENFTCILLDLSINIRQVTLFPGYCTRDKGVSEESDLM